MTVQPSEILLTGGSGRLGVELRRLLPGVVAPIRGELDVTRPETVERSLENHHPKVVVHAAAYTKVAQAENERAECWRVNVEGTRNIARSVTRRNIFLVHISTDYVFEGTTGGYKEDDPLGPPRNYYALSKLVAEEVARFVPRHLVIRTSFRPREWAYATGFTDLFTSQDYVDVMAPLLGQVIVHAPEIPFATLHVATDRKSTYELARRRKPDVQPVSKSTASVQLPADISLNTDRWRELTAGWKVDEV